MGCSPFGQVVFPSMSEVPSRGNGRPPKLTPELREQLLKWLRAGLPLSLATAMAGVHESNVRIWRAKSRSGTRGYRGFDEDVVQAMSEGEAVNVARISAAGKTNWRAAAWLLERTHPERWGPPQPFLVPNVPPLDPVRTDDQAGL